jgi:hypothetical protein
MSATVFVGPTLAAEEIGEAGDFVILPPVAQGDVYRAVRRGARVIGIVDGYFSGAPSVWHKEILWAISEGIAVFGSASMGALRAAELHAFGMRGVGRIFEAFRDGTLEDDDEVAVLHGPAEIGYPAASEPMVNIRATLLAAEAVGVVRSSARVALERYAKGLFFGERNWSGLLEAGDRLGVPRLELAALAAWVDEGRVDQKRLDALTMLAEIRAFAGAPARPNFHFEWTYLWDVFVSRSQEIAAVGGTISPSLVLDELRLEGLEAYRRIEVRALLRALSRMGARAGEPVDRQGQRRRLAEFRSERGLYLRRDLDRWMSANDLEAAGLEALIEDETRLDASRESIAPALDTFLLDELRREGDYPRLAGRARRKSEISPPGERLPLGFPSAPLALWWFEQRLGRPMPDDVAVFARRLGFADVSAFERALYRERQFLDVYPELT